VTISTIRNITHAASTIDSAMSSPFRGVMLTVRASLRCEVDSEGSRFPPPPLLLFADCVEVDFDFPAAGAGAGRAVMFGSRSGTPPRTPI
jgi:hypothetical protein